MNTQSSYVYHDHSGGEGLGRIALQPAMVNRFMPAVKEPAGNNLRVVLPTQRKSRVGRVSKPTPVLKPTPIIDHNPVPLPRLNIKAFRETVQNKTRQIQKNAPAKTPKGKPLEAVQKIAKAAQKKGEGKGILDGSINIGSYEIKKTRVALAGGATAGGLLLLKLLL